MQVSRSPTARWTSAAATAESTPPDRAQMTSPSEPVSRACASTRSRMPATVVSVKLAGVQVGETPAMATTKLRRMSRPRGVWTTSGWNWMPYRLRLPSAEPPVGVGFGSAGAVEGLRGGWSGFGLGGCGEAVREARDGVGVAHPDGLFGVDAAEQVAVRRETHPRWAVLAVVERDDVAAELVSHQLGAVADPEDRHLAGPDGRVRSWRAGVIDGIRAPRQDVGSRAAPFELVVRGVERQELGVHIELPNAPRGQLGELAAEVEDDDRASGRACGAGGAVVGGTFGRGCLERGLEVGLDLGVVGGEDAVPGVGGLTVDGLAALPWRRRVLVVQ